MVGYYRPLKVTIPIFLNFLDLFAISCLNKIDVRDGNFFHPCASEKGPVSVTTDWALLYFKPRKGDAPCVQMGGPGRKICALV
jgi:hypothetical protein